MPLWSTRLAGNAATRAADVDGLHFSSVCVRSRGTLKSIVKERSERFCPRSAWDEELEAVSGSCGGPQCIGDFAVPRQGLCGLRVATPYERMIV